MSSKYLPVHDPSRRMAQEICKDCHSQLEKWIKITNYVNKSFVYDYIRAITIPKRGSLPDLDRCWNMHMGICLDIASMTTGMLQAVGINARLIFGFADRSYHAWVEAKIGDETYRYDHENPKDNKVKKYRKIRAFK